MTSGKAISPFFHIFLGSILLLLFVSSFAQSGYQYTTYTQDDGLASGTLKGIAQDSTGFLWFTSENGLSRFDGYEFKVFEHDPNDKSSLSSSNINLIHVDKKGRMLLTTANTLSFYYQEANRFEVLYSFRNFNDFMSEIKLPGALGVFKANELIWINTETKVVKNIPYPPGFIISTRVIPFAFFNHLVWVSNGKTILQFDPASTKFRSIKLGSNNTAPGSVDAPLTFFQNDQKEIFYVSATGLYKYNFAQHSFALQAKLKLADYPPGVRKKVFQHKKNFLVMISRFSKVDVIDLRTLEYFSINLEYKNRLIKEPVEIFETTQSGDGGLWISTLRDGVFKVNLEQRCITEHLFHDPQNKSSLESNTIEFMLEKEGVLWMTSPGIGLIKAEPERSLLQAYRPGELQSSSYSNYSTNVRAINEFDENHLLIGTLKRLWLFNKSSHLFSDLPSPIDGKPILTEFPVSSIYKDKADNIWISNWGQLGITVLNYKTKSLFTIQPNDLDGKGFKSIRSMFIDTNGFLWLGMDNSVIYRLPVSTIKWGKDKSYTFEKFTGKTVQGDSLIFTIAFTFTENQNKQVLIGTDNGIYLYDHASNQFTRNIKSRNSGSLLNNNSIRAFYWDEKWNLWIGTNGGGLNSASESFDNFTSYTRQQGLSDNFIYTIQKDGKGNLWMGTNRGICCFNPTNQYVRNYSLKDGIQNYEFNTNASFKTKQNELVFGGINGFNIFNPEQLNHSSKPPTIAITEFVVNDKNYPQAKDIQLNHDQNSISFQFAALSYYRNRYNFYAYKLDGVNKDWVNCGTRRFSNYASLSPGEYTFHVRACNYNGTWSKQDALIHFTITPPFWSTWWFKLLLALLVSAFVFLLFRYRLRQKLEVEHIRNRIARDLHDEIGSNLTSISIFSAVAIDEAGQSKVTPVIEKISEYTQASLQAMNDIVWMINARNDTFEKIIVRMRKYAAEIFESTSIQLHINLDENVNRYPIQMEMRKNFYLIFKEAVNNTVKYAECKNVWIDLTINDHQIELTIKDDGKGFDASIESQGNGLINMQKRANELKGNLRISSSPGKGAIIHFTFKT